MPVCAVKKSSPRWLTMSLEFFIEFIPFEEKPAPPSSAVEKWRNQGSALEEA